MSPKEPSYFLIASVFKVECYFPASLETECCYCDSKAVIKYG